MNYYHSARIAMVKNQLMTNKVSNQELLEIFEQIPRHEFVDGEWKSVAYSDARLPMSSNRTMLSPDLLARMIQALDIEATHKVLAVGCGTGYTLAILAQLCAKVVGVEADNALAAKAATWVTKNQLDNVSVVVAEYFRGAPDDAPYNAIIVEGSVASCPKNLLDQLAFDAKLVCIEKQGEGISKVTLYQNCHGVISRMEIFDGYGDPFYKAA